MAQDPQLLSALEKLGLKESEVLVYLSVLEQGKATVLSIARATGIKRGTVYEITTSLIDEGFLKVTVSEKKRYLIAEDPRIVTAKFKEYADTLSTHLPQLLAMQNSNENKPKVTFYEGEEEVWQIYEDTLRVGLPILSYTSVIDINRLLDPKKIEDYVQRRVKKNIPLKVIMLDSESARYWAKRAKEDLREVRLIPKEKYDFSADVEIYGNKVAIISYREDIFGLIIESEQISQMHRMAFELMWQGAGAYPPYT